MIYKVLFCTIWQGCGGKMKKKWGSGEQPWLATEITSHLNGSWVYGMLSAARNGDVSLRSASYPSARGGMARGLQGKEDLAPSFEKTEHQGKTCSKTATVATLPHCFGPCSVMLPKPLYCVISHQYNAKQKEKKKAIQHPEEQSNFTFRKNSH